VSKARVIVFCIFGACALAIAIDRLSYAIWKSRLNRFEARLIAESSHPTDPANTILQLRRGRMGDPDPRLTVAVARAGVIPESTSHGAGESLRLLFIPPRLAWSTRLYPRTGMYCKIAIDPLVHHARVVSLRVDGEVVHVSMSKALFAP
jgi:hypothetical protein